MPELNEQERRTLSQDNALKLMLLGFDNARVLELYQQKHGQQKIAVLLSATCLAYFEKGYFDLVEISKLSPSQMEALTSENMEAVYATDRRMSEILNLYKHDWNGFCNLWQEANSAARSQ